MASAIRVEATLLGPLQIVQEIGPAPDPRVTGHGYEAEDGLVARPPFSFRCAPERAREAHSGNAATATRPPLARRARPVWSSGRKNPPGHAAPSTAASQGQPRLSATRLQDRHPRPVCTDAFEARQGPARFRTLVSRLVAVPCACARGTGLLEGGCQHLSAAGGRPAGGRSIHLDPRSVTRPPAVAPRFGVCILAAAPVPSFRVISRSDVPFCCYRESANRRVVAARRTVTRT